MALRYLDASHVRTPVTDLSGLAVRSGDDQNLGELDGCVIDPANRRLRYFVVHSRSGFRTHRYLVPVGLAYLDAGRRALHVSTGKNDLVRCPEFEPEKFKPYSDEDLIEALFHRTEAA
jgi:PRC-barrel domain